MQTYHGSFNFIDRKGETEFQNDLTTLVLIMLSVCTFIDACL